MHDILSRLIAILEQNETAPQSEIQITRAIWQLLQGHEPLRIESVAQLSQMSPASIHRFAKKLQFDGFLPLKKAILQAWKLNQQNEVRMSRATYEQFKSNHQAILTYNFELVRQGLEQTQKIIAFETLEQIVRLFGIAKTIHFVGLDYSHLVAKDAQQKFMRLGKMCTAHRNLQNYIEQTDIFDRDDVVVVFSFSGQTYIGQQVAATAKAQGLQVVVVTADPMSPVAQLATQIIQIAGEENAFTDSSTSGRLILHTVMDSIYLLYGTINNKNLMITE